MDSAYPENRNESALKKPWRAFLAPTSYELHPESQNFSSETRGEKFPLPCPNRVGSIGAAVSPCPPFLRLSH